MKVELYFSIFRSWRTCLANNLWPTLQFANFFWKSNGLCSILDSAQYYIQFCSKRRVFLFRCQWSQLFHPKRHTSRKNLCRKYKRSVFLQDCCGNYLFSGMGRLWNRRVHSSYGQGIKVFVILLLQTRSSHTLMNWKQKILRQSA